MIKNILLITITAIFVLGISAWASAQAESDEQMHMEHQDMEGQVMTGGNAKEAVNVGNKICPVSAEKIDEKTRVTYEYEGKVYNFCCASCIDEFKKDPEKYIKKVEEELESELKEESKHEEHEMQMMQEPETSDEGMHQGHHHSH